MAERGDEVESWIKKHRDKFGEEYSQTVTGHMWRAVDDILEDYRLHADTGTPLNEEVVGG